MGWDASRPVPWRRLLKEYAIYAGIMAVILVLLFRDRGVGGMLFGLVLALPLYLLLGTILAKLGYQRATLTGRRAAAHPSSSGPAAPDPGVSRPRPAPTKRTSAGTNRPPRRRR